MKKILFVIESLKCGGAEKSLITLLQNITSENYEIDLILFNKGGDFEKFLPKKVNVNYVDALLNLKGFNKLLFKLNFFILRKFNFKKRHHLAQLFWKTYGSRILTNDLDYDYAIAYNQGFSTYYVAEKIKAKLKYAWLNTDYKKAGYNINFDYDKYTKFEKIIAVSKECEKSLKGELKRINKELCTTVITDITDVDIVLKMSDSENNVIVKGSDKEISILSVGRLSIHKGWNMAVEACSILKNKGYKVKWYIIGEGNERNKLEKLIKEKNLEKDLILLGYKENPYPYIKSCDIYCQTSIFEGLSLTLIEASILNKPIVTTNFPTSYTILEDMHTGIIVEMNELSIAGGVEKLLIDENLKKYLVSNLINKEKNKEKERSLITFNKLLK